ncbi:MAG: N-acetylglucosamine kinase, partial [Synechococcaceae cyanobacterium]|nr:N-acetylglucosamine kinase [Synechococcaceae cyanobacterium]
MTVPDGEGLELLAGFDAGQSHTTCRIAAVEGVTGPPGRVVGEGEGPGVTHLAAEGGAERFAAALRESLRQALGGRAAAGGLSGGARLAAAGIGASGIEVGSPGQAEGCRLAAAALGLPIGRVAVTGDERTALRGAFPDGPGVLVISGTGTIAVGRDGAGRERRCGGW